MMLGALMALSLAATQHFAIVIGNNAPPVGDASLAPLRYADDDAAAFSEWLRGVDAKSRVLSLLDADSQRLYPEVAHLARAPTLGELSQAVDETIEAVRAAKAAGHDTVFWFFFSGHGGVQAGEPFLALVDGAVDTRRLYDDILARVPARYSHVFIDACHAEAIVRPRGNADHEPALTLSAMSDEERARIVSQKTLARFPNIGALVATSRMAITHEWDAYRHGVFTHQLLSALRGAADVNGDGTIEYSEVHAFLASANREVQDTRAHLDVIATAPPLNRRVPLVDLNALKHVGLAALASEQGMRFFIEDDRGVRLLDAHIEPHHHVLLALPLPGRMFLKSSKGEATFEVTHAQSLSVLDMQPSTASSKGALDEAFQRGLFAASFGPSYYRGFIDSTDDVPVAFAREQVRPAPPRLSRQQKVVIGLGSAALATTVSAVVLGSIALEARQRFEQTPFQSTALLASEQYRTFGTAFIVTGAVALTLAGATLGAWLWKAPVSLSAWMDDKQSTLLVSGHW